ncbi:ribonuclease H-like domain-containing protein [Aspergillus coremiiformis]|uniref:Ribonuclease H-like domain-containing protein n=1 Tax=Aspergillus coremiiformis TaxID=138285 RepID=A0A5N6ZF78_9EURO|nr:ribonuclease H-like domain-containing protein [Aspergillus coremiiformis]
MSRSGYSKTKTSTHANTTNGKRTLPLTGASEGNEQKVDDSRNQGGESRQQKGQPKGQRKKGKGKWQRMPLSDEAKPTTPTSKWSVISQPVQAEVLQGLEKLCESTNPHLARVCQTKGNVTGPARRSAVAIDCEMVRVAGKMTEVVQVCAVDVLTGEILVDKAVVPTRPVIDWCTRWSGMTHRRLEDMKRQGKAVNGGSEALAEVLKFVDGDTIVVGHALDNDLRALAMHHSKVLDTAIITRDAVTEEMVGAGCQRTWKLKTLCQDFLDKDIQQSSSGHDCVEDTLATREVLLWCVRNPDKLKAWAAKQSIVVQSVPSFCTSGQQKEDSIPFGCVEDFM